MLLYQVLNDPGHYFVRFEKKCVTNFLYSHCVYIDVNTVNLLYGVIFN